MDINTNVYSNDKITVIYKPRCCANAGICAQQLSSVFRNSVIPWIDLEGAKTDAVIRQINKCPSGALQYNLKQKDVA